MLPVHPVLTRQLLSSQLADLLRGGAGIGESVNYR